MISQKHTLNNVEYIVRARNKAELEKAVEFLYDCHEHSMAILESKLNQELDNILVSQFGEPEEPITAEPAIETLELRSEPKKPAPKTPRAKTPSVQKKDNKTVDLGKIGKGK